MFVCYDCTLDMSVDLDTLDSFLRQNGEEEYDYLFGDWSDWLTVTPRMLMALYRAFPGWIESARRTVNLIAA